MTHFNFLIILLIFLFISCEQENEPSVIHESTKQSIIVITDSLTANKGLLFYFDRGTDCPKWNLVERKIPVVLGKNGFGWGKGLHDSVNVFNYPIKREGDGRSPAGIFILSSVFGFNPEEKMFLLKMPYIQITEMIECIDDPNSEYYNQIISRENIDIGDVDWKSSENMYYYNVYYKLGVFVDQNSDPVEYGFGSCIFLHNWDNPNEVMAGCTAMHPKKMKEIVHWLDIEKKPILVQLTKQSYLSVMEKWKLPDISNFL